MEDYENLDDLTVHGFLSLGYWVRQKYAAIFELLYF